MSNAIAFGRKAFTWTVVVATILWAMSAAFIAIPLTAKAATLTAGDLIRGTEKSPYGGYPVYYYGSNGQRYLFPTASTYASWFGTDFSAVKVLTQAEVGSIPLGGNVTVKPTSKLIKVDGPDPKVYAVSKGGVLRHVASEAVASALYGAEWSRGIVTLPEGFFANYTVGAAVAAAVDFDKATVAASAADIGTDKGLGATPAPSAQPAVSGPLSAALASDNPAAAVLPTGSASVVLAKFNLTAGAAAQTVTGATLKFVGVGATTDFSNVYLYDGALRLTTGRTIAAQTRTVEFGNLAISVGASSSRAITVVADTAAAATSGDTHAAQLVSLATTASVSGLPVTAATFSIGSQAVSTVTLQRGADPAGPTIGQKVVAIGQLRLTAGANDVELRRATITVGGTVSVSDLSNFELWQGGAKIAMGVVAGDRVTFDLGNAPYAIVQGANRIFDIKADVAGRGGRTVTVYIDSTYPTDLLVVDKVYGYGSTITFTSFAAAATAASTPATGGSFLTTQGGRVTVAFNGPSATDVARGAQDVVLFKYSITAADQALELRRTAVTLARTGAAGFIRGSLGTRYFTDIKIKDLDTGSVVQGPREMGAAASATTTAAADLVYTDSFQVDAGKTRNLAVTADTSNSEDVAAEFFGNGYAITLQAFTDTSVREISTGQFLVAATNIVGGSQNIGGYAQTPRASALTISMSAAPASGQTVRGSQGVNIVAYSFTAGVASPVKITQIVLNGEAEDLLGTFVGDSSATLPSVILSASLWDGATQLGTTRSPSSGAGSTITFDNLQWDLGAGQTKTILVKVNLTTTMIAGATDFAYLGVSSVTAQDKDSNSVTATNNAANANGGTNFLTVNNAGTLAVGIDGDTPLASLVTSNTANLGFTKVKFTAAREGFRITKVRVVNTSGAAALATATADGMVTSLKLSYPKQDGTTGILNGSLVSGEADINFPTDAPMYVGVDQTKVLTISGDVADLSQATGRANALGTLLTPRFGLDMGITGDTNFEAVGAGSSTSITIGSDAALSGFTNNATADTADIVGNTMRVVKGAPTVTLHASSPSGGTTAGNNETLIYTVSNNGTTDLELAKVTFRVNSTCNSTDATLCAATVGWNKAATSTAGATANAASTASMDITDFTIYEGNDIGSARSSTAIAGTWALWNTTGNSFTAAAVQVGFATFAPTTVRTIPAGGSKTYIVKVVSDGATSGSNRDTLRLDIVDEPSGTTTNAVVATGSTATAGNARGSSLVWNETGSNAVTNLNGFLVKNLPVTGGSLSF